MKKQNLLLIIATGMLFSCSSKYPGYDSSESGLYYKIITENENTKKAKEGDVLTFDMIYKYKDSIIFNSKDLDMPTRIQLSKPTYKGDILEGLAMLGAGDSASFIISADSFFIKNVGLKELPPFVKQGEVLTFNVKLKSIQTKEEFEKEKKLQIEKYSAMIESRKNGEQDSIQAYLTEKKITSKPTPTGLYFIESKRGTGPKAVKGNKVTVNYTGRFLNGNIFDSSEGAKPISFTIGNQEVIPGWEEGVTLMSKGAKAVFLIPSNLAYGPRGAGEIILPYTPLVFDVELIDVSTK